MIEPYTAVGAHRDVLDRPVRVMQDRGIGKKPAVG
jgi:hypothetical protein